jgi:hypothetical protein
MEVAGEEDPWLVSLLFVLVLTHNYFTTMVTTPQAGANSWQGRRP